MEEGKTLISILQKIELTPVSGSEYCQFSIIENKLKILYDNQEKLLLAIKLLSETISKNGKD